MNKRMIKAISLILTIALVLDVFAFPMTTAFASNENADGKVIIQYEGEAPDLTPSEPTEQPEPSNQPEPSQHPEETLEPIPSIVPESTPEPSPSTSELPVITEPPVEETNPWPVDATLQSLLDENGFLKDEAFDILQSLPCEEEKYTEITNLGKGKYAMKLYTDPIKYQNDDGEYELIDNSIVAIDPKEGAEHEYKNAASDLEVLMSNDLQKDSAIEINYKNYTIGFKPLNVIKKNEKSDNSLNFIIEDNSNEQGTGEDLEVSKAIQEDNAISENEEKTDEIRDDILDETKEYESVEYTQTFNENTDIQITPIPSGVKEDIILYEIPEETEFSYEFNVENVTPVLRQDGNLYFIDLKYGYIVGAIPSPYMYDSKKEYSESYDIKVTLVQIGENTYKYTLIPNREFLEAENTVYPVIIDPSWLNGSSGCIQDTFTTSRYSGNNYANDANIKVGYSSDLYKSRGLAKISNWPISRAGYYITRGAYVAYQNYDGSSSPTIQIAQITSGDWDVNSVKWSNQPGGYTVVSQQTVSSMQWYLWDITDLVRGWYLGSINNFGIYVKSSNEDSNMYKRFYSSNDSSVGDYFYIEYFDCDAPHKPNISLNPNAANSWTTNTTPVLSWSIDADVGSGMNRIEYRIDDRGDWQQLGAALQGSKQINVGGTGNHIIKVHGVDNGGNVGPDAEIVYKADCSIPTPTGLKCEAFFSGPTGDLKYSWSAVTDDGSGLKNYQVGYFRTGDSTWTFQDVSDTSFTLRNCPDNIICNFGVKAVDNMENSSAFANLYGITTPDCTGPSAPQNFNISVDNPVNVNGTIWTTDNFPTITWNGMTDEGDHFDYVEYQVINGPWISTGVRSGNGSFEIDASNPQIWPDGHYKIRVRGVDKATPTINYGTPSAYVDYYKDATKPEISLTLPEGNLKGIVSVIANMNDSGSGIKNWILDYDDTPLFSRPELTSDTTPVNGKIYEWDTTTLTDQTNYTVRLRVCDNVDNWSTVPISRTKAIGSEYINSQLQIDQPIGFGSDGYQPDVDDVDQYMIGSASTDVIFQKLNDGGIEGLDPGKLYVNNKLHDTETTAGEGLSFNAAVYENGKWLYPEGSIVFMYTQAKDAESGELYSTGTQQALQIADMFTDANQIDSSKSDHVERINNDYMQLTQTSGVFDSSGSFESIIKPFAGDINYIDLTVDQTVPSGASITYQVSVDGGLTWQAITPVSTNGGITLTPANRKYFIQDPVGDSVKMKATLTKSASNQTPSISSWSIDVRYTTYANALLIDNSFPKNARGMTNLVHTYHNDTIGCIELMGNEPEGTTGWVYSTVRVTSNDVTKACLEVEENPGGTGISYYISTQGGAVDTWQEITPNAQWTNVTTPGKEIVLRARLTGSGTNSPQLLSWKLGVQEKLAGSPFIVKLVDEPWNLSALTDVTHRTLLRWEKSETDGVTYNVYRSTTPYFVPCDELRVAEGITDTSWYDPYVDFDDPFDITFYYKITASKVFPESGTDAPRESLPSNEEQVTVASKDEIEKYLGLQNYWSYSGFSTGSGTGYVNVANGNMSYITTDIVVSDPFFATVMRRTFNSLATTKTPMGYSWDFSFNTCLLREENGAGTATAMILKDGDGSFHYFEAINQESFKSAKGTFMELLTPTQLHQLGIDKNEYQIKRKDNIVYHFDAESLKLTSFSDSNGNELKFSYDLRGNLVSVENTVGEKVELAYRVLGETPDDPDYTPENADYVYVNWHPDLLDTVTWTEGGTDDPVSITYHYEYNDNNDKLERAKTTIEHSTTYEEVFSYNDNKQLISVSDPKDKETHFNYDSNGRVNDITDASGKVYHYHYPDQDQSYTSVANSKNVTIKYQCDNEGRVTRKTDALGHYIDYTYGDTADNEFLVTGMSYLNSVNGEAPQMISYSYTYIDGNIDTITAPDGTVTDYGTYDSFNKPESVTVSKGSDSAKTTFEYENGNLKKTIDPEGKKTINTYSTVNGHAGYLTQVQGDFGNQTRYSYDIKGRVTEVNEYDNGSPIRRAASYDYDYDPEFDVEGHYFMHVTATDPMGKTVTTYYDMLGRAVKKVYPDNSDIENEVNRKVYECWSYDLVGNVEWMRDSNGYETSYHYDELYRMDQVDYADGSQNSVNYTGEWDSDNNVATGDSSGNDADYIEKADGTGIKSIEYYDKAGRLVKTSVSSGPNELVTARYEYDNIGNCIQVTDNAGRVSQAQYNNLNQQTKTIVDPTGENIQTTFAYDFLGNQKSVTDGENNTTWYTYDKDSRLTMVKQANPYHTREDDGIDPFYATVYAYDLRDGSSIINSTTRTTINSSGNIVSADAQVSETVFDNMGRKQYDYNLGIVSPTDQTKMQTIYSSYNANFQPEIVTRNDNTKEKYTYNAFGSVKRIDYYEAGESTTGDSDDYIVYEYDNSGKVTKESVARGGAPNVTVYAYDNMGRLRQMRQGKEEGTLTINYVYDRAGKVRFISYLKGAQMRTLAYEYDQQYGRIQYIKLALGEQPDDADDVLESAKKVREYVYKPDGDLDHIKDFRNFDGKDVYVDLTAYIKTAYTINNAGLTTGITYTDYTSENDQTGTDKEKYTMGYDDRGFITTETAMTNYGTQKTVNKAYQYDGIGRLTTATIGDKTNTYKYDSFGNRKTMVEGTDTFTYNYDPTGFNRLMEIKKGNDVTSSYTYDDRGNQKTETQKYLDVTIDGATTSYDKTTKYYYDLSNQLSGLTTSTPVANQTTGDVTYDKKATVNAYNAGGQRIERTDGNWLDANGNNIFENGELQNGATTQYYYTGSEILYTTKANSFLLTENILDLDGSIIASARFEDETPDVPDDYFFYHYDMRGSTTAIIQPDGNLIKGYEYDEFGNLTQDANSFLNEITYSSSVTDTSSGLQYMNSRYYQPSTGRFLSQDTYTGNPYDPWTQHLYSYCGNNPVNMIDPTGHFWYLGNTQQSNSTSFKEAQENATEKEYTTPVLEPLDILDSKINGPLGMDGLKIILAPVLKYNGKNAADFINNPSVASFLKWFSMGNLDWERMTNNDNPLSLDHWMANINGFLYAYSLYKAGANFAGEGGAGKGIDVAAVEAAGKTGTVWDNIVPTAKNLPNTEIPATFQVKIGGSTLWTNANATEHMGEYVGRFGAESWTIGSRSQAMLSSYYSAVEEAMGSWSSLTPGRHYGIFGGWQLGINTETNVIYHAFMQ